MWTLSCVSAAEIERLWSIAGYILIKQSTSLLPLMLKCILYLNCNKDLWSDSDIRAANKMRKECNRKDIQAKIEEQAEWRNGHATAMSNDEGEEEEEEEVVVGVVV